MVHGWNQGQGWILGRVKTMIGRLFHVGYTVQGVWRLLRGHGWSLQVPAHGRSSVTTGRSGCGTGRSGPG
uniref:helix-turn-helix domain-containing protein n=1 Tax=Saccharothrix syringae TaxID=103733 RepID=UPI000A75854B